MLGIGRASQYAGWWSGSPSFETTVTVGMTARPSIDDGTSLYANDWTSPDFGNNLSMSFNSSGLGSNQSAIYSCTFKASTVSNITWADQGGSSYLSPSTFNSAFSNWTPWKANFANSSGTSCTVGLQVIRRASDNRVGIIWTYGTFGQVYFGSGLDWDTAIANKFISVVVCHSPTSSSFANWGSSVPTGSQAALRVVLVNASTGALISTVDTTVNIISANIVANPSAVTWRPYWQTTLAAGDFNTQTFTCDGDVPNRNYLFVNSGWVSIGDILDPTATDSNTGSPNYAALSGQGMPSTVATKQAWVNFYSTSTYVDNSGPSYNGSTVWNGLYQLSPSRTATSTNIYSFMPASFHTSPLTDSAHP